MKVKSLSHVQLFATPWTAAYQAPPSMGFSRQEYWSRVPLPSPLQPLVRQLRNICFSSRLDKVFSSKILFIENHGQPHACHAGEARVLFSEIAN